MFFRNTKTESHGKLILKLNRNLKGMGNCEEIRCIINATERPLSNCMNVKANPS